MADRATLQVELSDLHAGGRMTRDDASSGALCGSSSSRVVSWVTSAGSKPWAENGWCTDVVSVAGETWPAARPAAVRRRALTRTVSSAAWHNREVHRQLELVLRRNRCGCE